MFGKKIEEEKEKEHEIEIKKEENLSSTRRKDDFATAMYFLVSIF